MKALIISSMIVLGGVSLLINCSDVDFKPLPSQACVNFNSQDGSNCTVEAGGLNDFTYSADTCKTDILFVVDNSGSMSTEQQRMAQSFPNFLGSIDDMDYQIAVTTTDTINDNGRLLPFGNGSKFIDKGTSNSVSLFENNIRRSETIACDNGDSAACASNDERGIFAANLAIMQARTRGNLNTFFRSEAHLAVIFLSDEDVRGNGGRDGKFLLTELDKPDSLVSNVTSHLGTHKTLSAHPIVVTSNSCQTVQLAQIPNRTTFASNDISGLTYLEFLTDSSLRASGTLTNATAGNICASNYTSELNGIATGIEIASRSTPLACNPRNLQVVYNGSILNQSNYSISATNVLSLVNINNCGQLDINYQCGL